MQIFIPICHTSNMAEPVVYSMAEVVGYKDRLYRDYQVAGGGFSWYMGGGGGGGGRFSRYTLEDIDSADVYLAHKHEMEKAQNVVLVECFSYELFGEDLAAGMQENGGEVQENHRPAVPATEIRFADLGAKGADWLAEARTRMYKQSGAWRFSEVK